MELVEKMRELILKTPERPSRSISMLSTPGLPSVVDNKVALNESIKKVVPYPTSPQACTYPVVVPHRIFVGGFAPETTEHELRCYFERFGIVRDVKIIRDENECSLTPKYSYGFVTFATEEEAQTIVEFNKAERGRAFKFQGRYLTVNEAVKKPSNKHLRMESSVSMVAPPGCVYRDQNGHLLYPFCPSYVVMPATENNMSQPQCMAIPPTMVPVIVQPPQTVFQLPTSSQQPSSVASVASMPFSQFGGLTSNSGSTSFY